MKKEWLISTSALKNYFLVFLLLTGIGGYINAQNIDFCAPKIPYPGGCPAAGTCPLPAECRQCPNDPFSFHDQEGGGTISGSGPLAIPSITAVNPPEGATITMSITNIDVSYGGFSTGEGCSSCTGPVTIHGIIFTASGASFTITGTPDYASIGYTYSVTLQAAAGGITCSRTYNFNVVAYTADDGDPHMTTVDGVHYDFQGAGEFIVLRGDSGDNFEIQTRQTPVATNGPGTDSYTGLSTCVSLNTAVAARIGSQRVTYQPNINGSPDSSGMQLRVDGKLATLDENGIDLGSGGRIVRPASGGIEIDFPNGASLVAIPNWWSYYSVWYLNVHVYRTRATKGTMGIIAPLSWLPKLPDGTSVGPLPESLHERFATLYQKFADAWRVTDKTSLFDYAPGTSTSTFTNKNWPVENAESCSIENQIPPKAPIDREVAEKLSSDILDPAMKANAIFDVMVTGEPTFTKVYLNTQQTQTVTTVATVNSSKDTTRHGEPVTFTAAVARKFLPGKDMLAGSVEFTVDGKKLEQVKLDANGNAVLTTTSLEVGSHQIVAMFIPDSGSTAVSSSSLSIIHTVIGTAGTPILHQWWFWLILIIIILIIWLAARKKKNP